MNNAQTRALGTLRTLLPGKAMLRVFSPELPLPTRVEHADIMVLDQDQVEGDLVLRTDGTIVVTSDEWGTIEDAFDRSPNDVSRMLETDAGTVWRVIR